MQNKANFETKDSLSGVAMAKTERHKPALSEVEGTEYSKITAKTTPKWRFSITPNLFYKGREFSTNRPFYAQQSQFARYSNERKLCYNKGL